MCFNFKELISIFGQCRSPRWHKSGKRNIPQMMRNIKHSGIADREIEQTTSLNIWGSFKCLGEIWNVTYINILNWETRYLSAHFPEVGIYRRHLIKWKKSGKRMKIKACPFHMKRSNRIKPGNSQCLQTLSAIRLKFILLVARIDRHESSATACSVCRYWMLFRLVQTLPAFTWLW